MLKLAHLRCWCCKEGKNNRIFVIKIDENKEYGYEWAICIYCGHKWENYHTTEIIKTIKLSKKATEFIYANISSQFI